MKNETAKKRGAVVLIVAVLAVLIFILYRSVMGGGGGDPAEKAFQTLETAISENQPEGAVQEQSIEAKDGKTVVVYSRDNRDAPFLLQAYGQTEDGWKLLSSRAPQLGKQNAVQELFPAQDNLLAICISALAEDVEQQAYEYHMEGQNGWVLGYNPIG